MWEEELFPGVTLDDVAGEAAASFFPPMAGGAPGLLSEFQAAWSWAKSRVIDPVASWLGGFVGSLAKAVMAAIGGLLSIMQIRSSTRGVGVQPLHPPDDLSGLRQVICH